MNQNNSEVNEINQRVNDNIQMTSSRANGFNNESNNLQASIDQIGELDNRKNFFQVPIEKDECCLCLSILNY